MRWHSRVFARRGPKTKGKGSLFEARGTSPPPGHAGLYHAALLYSDRASLAAVIRRGKAAAIPLAGAAHRGDSKAGYLDNPDGNGVDLYHDFPRGLWPRDGEGHLTLASDRFSSDAFLDETEKGLDA